MRGIQVILNEKQSRGCHVGVYLQLATEHSHSLCTSRVGQRTERVKVKNLMG